MMDHSSHSQATSDVMIIGGGVIGLSLARELAEQGRSVTLVERGALGREASWAGAGILPAARWDSADSPCEQIAGLSQQMHQEWARQLREETGIETGYRAPGELFLAFRPEEVAQLQDWFADWQRLLLEPQHVPPAKLTEWEPVLTGEQPAAAAFLPKSGQLRNPWHLRALVASCHRRGVRFLLGTEIHDFDVAEQRVQAALSDGERLVADQFCLATGAWSGQLAQRLRLRLAIKPIRGQIALLRQDVETFSRVINVGHCYLVPRSDGRVLVGATMEDVGFHRRTTVDGIASLLALAQQLVPSLARAELEQSWAGLRPGTIDGLPYLGPLPGFENLFVAAGHFRSGLQLSTGTARVMAQLMTNKAPAISLDAFRVDRH